MDLRSGCYIIKSLYVATDEAMRILVTMKYQNLVSMIFMFCLTLNLYGCSEEMRAQFGSMFEIIDKLAKEYHHDDIKIKISNGKFLTVNFINSQFNDIAKEEMESKAREIALFTVSSLEKNSNIENIAVVFTIHEQKYLVVSYTNTLNTFFFDVSDLRKDLNENQPNKSPAGRGAVS